MSAPIADGMIVVLIILILYSYFGLLIEKHKPIIGHEASIIIALCMIFSYFFNEWEVAHLKVLFTFDSDFFFIFCLPPIVFASAFNMRRQVFFQNFDMVLIFGLLSTIV